MTITIKEIVLNNAEFVKNSGYSVNANQSMETVSIEHNEDSESDVFLQGHEASDFINEAQKTYEEADVTFDEALLHHAKPFIEC